MVDFSECKLIENEMKFYTYDDFCRRRKIIKDNFLLMTENGRIFYKYYVYANSHMDLRYKNKIWDFLNGFDDNGFELLKMLRFYKPM